MLRFCFLILSALALYSGEVTLFRDWVPDAKGNQDLLCENGGLEASLSQRLASKHGDLLSHWEKDAHRLQLLSWRSIHSIADLGVWLKNFFNRKNIIPAQTRYWMFWNLGVHLKDYSFQGFPQEKLVLMLWEPPTVQPELYTAKTQKPFGTIFTWDDDLVDGVRFFKFYYPVWGPPLEKIPSFEEKKFCVMINRRFSSRHPKELYSERENTIRYFENFEGEFDLYGGYWEKRGYRNWRGPLLTDKLETLKLYKFCICYENTHDVNGYITEKIFDCLRAGVVPVYWGAENIDAYVPRQCFIDRRLFYTNDEMAEFLRNMSKETYDQYVEAGRSFLKSPGAQQFSKEAFVENLIQILYRKDA